LGFLISSALDYVAAHYTSNPVAPTRCPQL
jgi:hypothetical protein